MAWSLARSAGVWRLGFGGLAGVDWVAAEALHGDPASWPATREYLRFIESGAMRGAAEKAEREKAAAPVQTGGEGS